MPSRPLSLLSDLPFDTPPLSPSRSPSSTSATRSSVASSNSSVSLGDLGARMSQTRIDPPVSHKSTESVDSQGTSRKFAHDSIVFSGARERDIEEEIDVDMDHDDRPHDRGRSGYEDRFDHLQNAPQLRPSMPRQGSYSKRHSSFDTPREVPFPCGYLASSVTPLSSQPVPSKEVQHERSSSVPLTPQGSENQLGDRMDTEKDATSNESTSGSGASSESPPPCRPHLERSSSSSLPLPTFLPYSSLPSVIPPQSPPRFENPRPAPMVPNSSINPTDLGVQSPVVSPPRTSSLKPPIPKMETPSPLRPRLPRQSPSPPLLADEPDVTGPGQSSHSQSRFMNPPYDPRPHNSLPPPSKYSSLSLASPSSSPSRPTSLPHALNNSSFSPQSHAGASSLPPPQPPTILTPPPPLSADEESARKPAPYEPFLPRDQPPADHTYIAVETVASEYRLIVRLPGFQRDSITLAMRRRRILHVVADNWSDGGGHFERRISFGYDADLASVRAEFDGEILRIIVPRRTLPGWFSQPTN